MAEYLVVPRPIDESKRTVKIAIALALAFGVVVLRPFTFVPDPLERLLAACMVAAVLRVGLVEYRSSRDRRPVIVLTDDELRYCPARRREVVIQRDSIERIGQPFTRGFVRNVVVLPVFHRSGLLNVTGFTFDQDAAADLAVALREWRAV